MQALVELIGQNQDFLVERVLRYARLHHYLQYTSSLEEAWTASVSGLSHAIISALTEVGQLPEVEADGGGTYPSIRDFVEEEARRHRGRGITLELYLGLMKYYRRAYSDLAEESRLEPAEKGSCLLVLRRCFDLMELSSCREWCRLPQKEYMDQLRSSNQKLLNLKNKYLAIFESVPTPVLLVDREDRIVNINRAARRFLQEIASEPGQLYDSPHAAERSCRIETVLPWLADDLNEFFLRDVIERRTETELLTPDGETRTIVVQLHQMLDIRRKYSGTVVTLFDMTEQKHVEKRLRYMSFHDPMTGLFNRTYYEEELVRAAAGRYNPFGVISCDIDGLKLVNDTLGHHAGDLLLTTVGGILMGCFRKCDVAARIGGDEFSVLMSNNEIGHVREACLRVRDRVAQHNRNQPKIPVSLSVGWACGNVFNHKEIRALIRRADVQMYEEKRTNRQNYNALFAERFVQYGEALYTASYQLG